MLHFFSLRRHGIWYGFHFSGSRYAAKDAASSWEQANALLLTYHPLRAMR
jgi:hypothetical protein